MKIIKKRYAVVILVLVIAIMFTSYIYWDNQRIVVREITITHPDLPTDFQDFRILHITDLEGQVFVKGNFV